MGKAKPRLARYYSKRVDVARSTEQQWGLATSIEGDELWILLEG